MGELIVGSKNPACRQNSITRSHRVNYKTVRLAATAWGCPSPPPAATKTTERLALSFLCPSCISCFVVFPPFPPLSLLSFSTTILHSFAKLRPRTRSTCRQSGEERTLYGEFGLTSKANCVLRSGIPSLKRPVVVSRPVENNTLRQFRARSHFPHEMIPNPAANRGTSWICPRP